MKFKICIWLYTVGTGLNWAGVWSKSVLEQERTALRLQNFVNNIVELFSTDLIKTNWFYVERTVETNFLDCSCDQTAKKLRRC